MSQPEYPKREAYFAHRFIRVLTKSCVTMDIGRDACLLLVYIAMQEDAARYRYPIKFWNSTLMQLMGFTSPKQLNSVRQKAVDAGWLAYFRDGTRDVGRYFVTIPPEFQDVDDRPIYSPEGTNNGTNSGKNQGPCEGLYPKTERIREYVGDESGSILVTNSGTNQGPPSIPVPDPFPEPTPQPHAEEVGEPKSKGPANAIAEAFMQATGRVCYVTPKRKQAVQARWKDPFWRENWQAALQRVGQSPFCNGKGERGWKMDLDFFLKPDTVAQVMEGKYDSKPSIDCTDYESHPEWQEILKILRKYGRDEMTDQQEWRAKNMTQAQKEARKAAFRRWEELEVYDDRQRKEAAKKYITELNRLISEGVPHK